MKILHLWLFLSILWTWSYDFDEFHYTGVRTLKHFNTLELGPNHLYFAATFHRNQKAAKWCLVPIDRLPINKLSETFKKKKKNFEVWQFFAFPVKFSFLELGLLPILCFNLFSTSISGGGGCFSKKNSFVVFQKIMKNRKLMKFCENLASWGNDKKMLPMVILGQNKYNNSVFWKLLKTFKHQGSFASGKNVGHQFGMIKRNISSLPLIVNFS